MYELRCRRGSLLTRSWLSDTARLTRPATRTFVIWDPAYYGSRGCTPATRDRQLGRPSSTRALAGGTEVLVFPGDLARLVGGDDGSAPVDAPGPGRGTTRRVPK